MGVCGAVLCRAASCSSPCDCEKAVGFRSRFPTTITSVSSTSFTSVKAGRLFPPAACFVPVLNKGPVLRGGAGGGQSERFLQPGERFRGAVQREQGLSEGIRAVRVVWLPMNNRLEIRERAFRVGAENALRGLRIRVVRRASSMRPASAVASPALPSTASVLTKYSGASLS